MERLEVAKAQSSLGEARGAVQTLGKALLQSDIQSLSHLKAETLLVIAGAMESSGDSDYARMCAEKAVQIISCLRSREHSRDLWLRAVSLLARMGELDGAYELADATNGGRDQVDAYLRIEAGAAARRDAKHATGCLEIAKSIVDSDTAASRMGTAERAECAVLLAESYGRKGFADLAQIRVTQAKELLADVDVGDAFCRTFSHIVEAELKYVGFDDALDTVNLRSATREFPGLWCDAPVLLMQLYRLIALAAVTTEQRDKVSLHADWSFSEAQRYRDSIDRDWMLQDALRELAAVDVGLLRFDSAERRARLAWLWGGSRHDWSSRENVITGVVRAYVGSDQVDRAWALYRSITGRFEHDYPVLPGVARGDCLLALAEGESRRKDLRLAAELLGDAVNMALSEGVAKADESALEVLADTVVLQRRLGFASDALATLNLVMASACWPVRRVVSTIAATKCGDLLSEVWRDSSIHQEIAHYLCQAAACDDPDMALSAAMALMEE